MCLAVPAKIIELNGDSAVVELSGVRRTANVAFIDSPRIGDHVLLHAGFAIQKWSDEDVREYEQIIREMGP
jgi:hydrogenase expression/formation protein HypC